MKITVRKNEFFPFTFYDMRAEGHSMKLDGSKFRSNNR